MNAIYGHVYPYVMENQLLKIFTVQSTEVHGVRLSGPGLVGTCDLSWSTQVGTL
jgi:hypothetical protein